MKTSNQHRVEAIQEVIQQQIEQYDFKFVTTLPEVFDENARTVGGYFVLNDDPDDILYVIFQVSMYSADVFVLMTDTDPVEISNLLGVILMLQGEGHLSVGDMIKFPQSDFLKAHDVFACTLLKPATLNYFDGIKHTLKINDQHFHLLMPVFINQHEYDLGQGDFDQLLDHFEDMKRDLLSISSQPIPDRT